MLTQQFWASVLWVRLIFVKRLSSRLLQNVLKLDCNSRQPKGEPLKMQMNCGKAWKSRYCFECSWSRPKAAPHDFCKMCRSRIAAAQMCNCRWSLINGKAYCSDSQCCWSWLTARAWLQLCQKVEMRLFCCQDCDGDSTWSQMLLINTIAILKRLHLTG